MLRRPLPIALLIGLFAQALFSWRLATPRTLVFDEIHYVPAARALLALEGPVNTEHPLLGKALIAIGIALFGDNSVGWRAMSTVAGTATVLGVYAVTWLLFGRVRTAALAAVLALLNFTLLVQARIAMLDGFMAAFVVGGLAMLLWSARATTGAAAWRRWLAGAALLGLAIGTKWAAVPYLAFAGLGFVVVRLRDVRSLSRALSGRDQPHWPGLAIIPALASLGLVAGGVYLLTFAPAFFYARDPLTLATLLPFQAEMWARQTQVLPSHTYQSAWWTWPPMLRPMWYMWEAVDGAQRGILLLGNPAVMWGGLIAVLACLWAGLRDRSLTLLAPAGLWLASWGVWGVIPKSLGFYYYYYLPSLFLPLAIAAAFDRYGRGKRQGWDETFVVAAGVLFAWFYPILAATALDGPRAFGKWMWFDSWV